MIFWMRAAFLQTLGLLFSQVASESCERGASGGGVAFLQLFNRSHLASGKSYSHDRIYFQQHVRRLQEQQEPLPDQYLISPTLALMQVQKPDELMNKVSIWPYPKSVDVSGPPVLVAGQLHINTSSHSAILRDGIARFQKNLNLERAVSLSMDAKGGNSVDSLKVFVEHPEETLSSMTDYSYKVDVSLFGAELHASSVFGALYGLETILQLAQGGSFPGSHIAISDAPDYAWRGVLVDAGRRFLPLSLLKNTIDIMSAVKLNVLHLHLSDYGRFAIESHEVPEIHDSLRGDASGYYTQGEVKALVAYAKHRGVRVVPEVDLPGHARSWRAAKPKVAFCEIGMNGADDTQLLDSEATLHTTTAVLREIISLFEDEAVHVGGDETEVVGRCTSQSRMRFTSSAASAIQQLNKTALLWEEALFQSGDVPKDAIVATWTTKHGPSDVLQRGHRTLNNNYDHSYLNFWPTKNKEWAQYYHDAAAGVVAQERNKVLGGEVSMWADEYCDTCQCGGWSPQKCTPSARQFWPRNKDEQFKKSFGGMLWPRGFVAAQALWQYAPASNKSDRARFDPNSELFHQQLLAVNDLVAKRGGRVCPSGCDCNEHMACGKSYLNE